MGLIKCILFTAWQYCIVDTDIKVCRHMWLVSKIEFMYKRKLVCRYAMTMQFSTVNSYCKWHYYSL